MVYGRMISSSVRSSDYDIFITAVSPHLIACIHTFITKGEVFINFDYNNDVEIKKQTGCHNHLPSFSILFS